MSMTADFAADAPVAPVPFRSVADVRGHFGPFGGRFVPETLIDSTKFGNAALGI